MIYRNPVIRGFNPDPSICRIGDDYYLVTSSFEYFPGIPVYHSTDLVNWTQIGNCINREGQLPMHTAKESGGIWAPTMRYHNGRFYVTATFDGKGNFIITSTDPAKSWSDPVWVKMGGIDPSLFFENGKAYYCTNQRVDNNKECITLAEIDIESGALISEIKSIWNGTGGGFLEAPHLYHIGGWYYIFAAEGGTNFNHMITVGRSRDIWGPYQTYEKNPILSNRNDTTKTVACSGHGDLVEDKNGNWWIVHLATRPVNNWLSHIGRETFLMPVTWQGEWPVIGNDCKSHIQADGPLWEAQKPLSSWEADFSSQQFAPRLLFLRRPSHENYVLKNGSLFLKPSMVDLCEAVGSPTLIMLRQPDISCEIFARMNFKACENGDEAGMTVYLSNRFFYKLCKKRINDKDYLLVEKFAEDFHQTAFCQETEEGCLNFKIDASPETYDFYCSIDDNEPLYLCSASTRFLSCELAGKCFTGVMTGLYTVCRQSTPAEAEILSFKTDCH